jgi:RNA polymerase sigma-32 factor
MPKAPRRRFDVSKRRSGSKKPSEVDPPRALDDSGAASKEAGADRVKNAEDASDASSEVLENDADSDADADIGEIEPASEDLEGLDESYTEADHNLQIVPRRFSSGAIQVDKPGSLARYDPIQAYMRDVLRYPLLSPEQEHEIAAKYFENGDVKAAADLVTANLRLVVKIAYDYRHAYKNLMDIVQEGNIGLMQAVKKYNPYKGVKLSTYAAWWIRAYILRFILNNARLVKVGTTQAQRKLFFNLKKEKAKLAALGIEPTSETVAKSLNVSKDEVVQMDRRLAAGDLSLDAPVSGKDGGSVSRVELLSIRSRGADDQLADEQLEGLMRDKLRIFGGKLTGKEAKIFHERLVADEPRTLQELGDEFGVSRERVRQLEKRLQQKLKQFVAQELGEDVFEP